MSIDGYDMKIKEQGWYQKNKLIGPMKDDKICKPFTLWDVFADPF